MVPTPEKYSFYKCDVLAYSRLFVEFCKLFQDLSHVLETVALTACEGIEASSVEKVGQHTFSEQVPPRTGAAPDRVAFVL